MTRRRGTPSVALRLGDMRLARSHTHRHRKEEKRRSCRLVTTSGWSRHEGRDVAACFSSQRRDNGLALVSVGLNRGDGTGSRPRQQPSTHGYWDERDGAMQSRDCPTYLTWTSTQGCVLVRYFWSAAAHQPRGTTAGRAWHQRARRESLFL
jgi:hypothetical protein